ncbi:CPBP family intramembrane glutamic endopeptidase [Marinilactibacillus sp. Marseille-P9653]|uniref:CPBP family intramembrane glutamic endopeptidase n=1 Tax=Marinilactibacillus sp. Marseille-P9653 TaxID=2866583 RepID=UPI001CE46301|nr:CPBP family intramembrane glutamic endopeptidase [Marinilactibacillus sp. Marseille-P9653]
MYINSLKKLSIWAIVWRSVLTMIGVEIANAFLLIAMQENYPEVFGLMVNLFLYFLIYKIILRQLSKQNVFTTGITGEGPPEKKQLLPVAGLTILVAICGSLFIYFALRIFLSFTDFYTFFISYMGLNPNELIVETPSFLYLLPLTVIAAPIVEEVFFRGVLMNKWSEKYGVWKGILFSSIIFMIIHFNSLFFPQLILGFLCAVVYTKTKKLIYPILTHALYNLIVIIPTLFTSDTASLEELYIIANPTAEFIQELTLYSIVFVIVLAVTILFIKKYGKGLKAEATPYLTNIPSEFLEHEPVQNVDDIENFEDF